MQKHLNAFNKIIKVHSGTLQQNCSLDHRALVNTWLDQVGLNWCVYIIYICFFLYFIAQICYIIVLLKFIYRTIGHLSSRIEHTGHLKSAVYNLLCACMCVQQTRQHSVNLFKSYKLFIWNKSSFLLKLIFSLSPSSAHLSCIKL